MYEPFTLERLIKTVPNTIRVEILKKKLLDIYNVEVKIRQRDLLKELEISIDSFLYLIEAANLPDDRLIELYQFAKEERKKLELKDNLFNIYEFFIKGDHNTYNEINEEISKRLILK